MSYTKIKFHSLLKPKKKIQYYNKKILENTDPKKYVENG